MRQHPKIQPMSLVQAPTKTRSFFHGFHAFGIQEVWKIIVWCLSRLTLEEATSTFCCSWLNFGNSAVLRKLATPSNSMYHLQCQLCMFWDKALHVGCAGCIGLRTPDNRSTCQLHMLAMCAYDSTMPPGNSTSILKMTRWKRMVFPASVSYIYIYIIIYQVGGFFSSTQVDKTEANWIISSMAIRNIRNDLKSTRWPGHLSPFPIISALVPRYTPSSPWPWFQRGWLPGFAGVVAILSFYGEIQESDGKFKHPTKI